MKISCIQMNMTFAAVEENFLHAAKLIAEAMRESPDVIVLPETWNTGFIPTRDLPSLCDRDGARTKKEIGALAKLYHVNIVAGSIANIRDGQVRNTACIFDREGQCIAEYDKTHLFSPMGEQNYFTPGDSLCRFTLDGVSCGVIICYDLRFPELIRSLTVQGIDVLFVVSQWPGVRTAHLRALLTARAIENQMFVACCNSCGKAGSTQYGGLSSIVDPWGETRALAGEGEEILCADCDLSAIETIRATINVFADRRPELYRIV